MADFGTGSEASEDKSLRRDHLCRGEKRIQKTKGSTVILTSGHCISPRLVCLSSWSLEVRVISATN
ncbi:hypothetical protein N7536_001378 [Penicillium majusculum]|nr:hypothetical protein N7536_001378 [Penicillium majusculum]